MIYERHLLHTIRRKLVPNKVLLLIGARRVGKTHLTKQIMKTSREKNIVYLTGDDLETHQLLERRTVTNYKRLMGNSRFLIIDEAQEITEIGKKLKLMVDEIKGIKILATGSSSFALNNQLGEPLVGRMSVYRMYPLAQMEIGKTETYPITQSQLPERLIYGSYPELVTMKNEADKQDYLRGIVSSYLLRDIIAFEGIKSRDTIIKLLQKIAFRVGSQISLNGLGNELQISKNTVDKYLDLFKKTYILYDVVGFSRNRDNEITKMKKWYFNDNGIRNAVINDFRSFELRDDIGLLWENYLNSERNKYLDYTQNFHQNYFWRTHTQQEIDRIEEKDNQIGAYEYKWSKETSKTPSEFSSSYPNANYTTIHRMNYLDFITK